MDRFEKWQALFQMYEANFCETSYLKVGELSEVRFSAPGSTLKLRLIGAWHVANAAPNS